MRFPTMLVLSAVLLTSSAFADAGMDAGAPDAGTLDSGTISVAVIGTVVMAPEPVVGSVVMLMDAGTVLAPMGTVAVVSNDGGTVFMDPFANPLGSVKEFYVAVKSGNYWWAAALLLFGLVGLLRMWGKKLHALIPDDNPLDTPFYFLFDTKIGGWVFNWVTAICMCLAAGTAAGVPVDGDAWKTALFISTSGTTLVELWKDVKEWWNNRKAKAAEAAGLPPPPVVPGPPPSVP